MASVWDLVVRVMGESAQFREDIMQDKASLDDLLMTIHDKDLTVNVNAQEADAKLELIKQRLREIKDTSALIRVDDERAKEKVDEFKQKLRDIMDAAAEIRIDDAKAEEKIRHLRDQIDELKIAHAKIPIEIEDGDAFEKLEAIRLDLDELHDKHITVDIDQRGNVNRFAQDTANAQKQWNILSGILMTTIPTLSPLMAGLVGATGGLLSAFGAATPAVIGFGVVAKSNLSEVLTAQKNIQAAQQQLSNARTYQEWLVATENMKAATHGLNQEQIQAVDQLGKFESFWHSFTKSFQAPVLNVFTQGLKALQTILTDMRPAIEAAGNAFGKLLTGLNSSLNGSGAKDFFTWMGKEAGPAILSFGQAAANVFSGLGSLMMAFTPVSHDVEGGLVNMTAAFANWAKGLSSSKTFEQFVQYFKTNGPLVMKTLGDLVKLIANLLTAMAPAGHVMLQVIDGIVRLVNWVLHLNPIIGQLGAAIMVGIGVMNLVAPVVSGIITAIRFMAVTFMGASAETGAAITALSGPIGWIIAAVVAAVILIVTHWKQISKVAEEVWHAVATFFSQLGRDIAKIWDSITKEAVKVWNAIVAFFKKWGLQILEFILGPVGDLVIYIAKHWDEIVAGVEDLAKRFVDRFNKIVDFLKALPGQALQWGENMMHMLAQGIENGIQWVEDKVKAVASKIKSFLGFGSPTEDGPGATSDRWMPNLMNMLTDGIQQGIPKVHAALNQVIIPPNSSAMMSRVGTFAGAGSIALHANVNVHGNVYSTDDISAAVQQGAQQALSQFVGVARKVGRAGGIASN